MLELSAMLKHMTNYVFVYLWTYPSVALVTSDTLISESNRDPLHCLQGQCTHLLQMANELIIICNSVIKSIRLCLLFHICSQDPVQHS